MKFTKFLLKKLCKKLITKTNLMIVGGILFGFMMGSATNFIDVDASNVDELHSNKDNCITYIIDGPDEPYIKSTLFLTNTINSNTIAFDANGNLISNTTYNKKDIVKEEEVVEEEEESKEFTFDILDITKPSNISKKQLEYFIALRCPEWIGLEDYILSLDEKINIVFLLTVGRLESGAGYDVVGDFNCFNTRDFYTGKYINYNSYKESIDAFVNLILEQYCAEDGMWHEEYVKDEVSYGKAIMAIAKHYADEEWGHNVINLGEEIFEILSEVELEDNI